MDNMKNKKFYNETVKNDEGSENIDDERSENIDDERSENIDDEGSDNIGVEPSKNIDDDYTALFNKFIYSGSVSFLIILIVFLITVNVLSVGYYQHKSTHITLVDDVESILTNSVAAFNKNEIKEHIFTDTYKNLLNWHQRTNTVGSFIYRLINSIFPPLIIVAYFLIFCILQLYTFFKGMWVTLINTIEVDISTIIFIFTLTILFVASVPLFYYIINKGINLSIVSSILFTILYFVIFSSLPFTGFSSFYIFIMIFFNSYNKINKLFFNISPLMFLFLIYILITFCSISLAQKPPQGVKITSGVIIGLLISILSLIIVANLIKTFNPNLFTNWFFKHFKNLITVPEFEI
jgi:hypothetical protein